MGDQRWATFDCYGTLVDWNAGIRAELGRLFVASAGDRLLARYHVIEPQVQEQHPSWSYRGVMAAVLAELASEAKTGIPAGEEDALARSLPQWPVFPEVPEALAEAHRRGWNLFALSNSDRDLIDASVRAIGVPFEGSIVASEIGSYKPAHGHWLRFYEAPALIATATCMSPRAIFTTSCRRVISSSARSGPTGSARRATLRRRGSCRRLRASRTFSMS